MLVLSRFRGEKIVVGAGTPQQVTITVCEVDSRGKVRIGVECDRSIEVWREELLPARAPERRDALSGLADGPKGPGESSQ